MVREKKKKTANKKIQRNSQGASLGTILLDGERLSQGATSADIPTSEEIFQSVVQQVEDYAIITLDAKGRILSWNTGAEKIKGYSAKEIIGKNYRIFYTKEDKEINLSDKLLADAARNKRTSYEGWRVRKDGQRFWGSMTLTALHSIDGGLKGFLKISRDLTEKKTAEERHNNFVEQLKLKNEELRQSEDRYHKMVSEVVDYAIILLDPDGKILDWNKGAEKVKGYSAEEIIGKSFRLFYPKEERHSGLPEQLLGEAARKGSVFHEGWRIRKDGRRFWGNVAITALHDERDHIIGYSKVTRDLTDKKIAEDKVSNLLEELRQANDQLKESEERYHKMIEEVQSYAIILLDKKGNVENWNKGAQLIKGYTAEEIVGKNFRLFYPPDDLARKLPESLLAEASKSGKATHEGWRVRKDGSRFWGSVVITALHDLKGEIMGFSKVTRDLTERKAAEDALKASAAQLELKNKILERLNEELSSFTHIVSHDLKEPLRKIQTFVSRIADVAYEPEKTQEYVGKIKSSAVRMQNLIEGLLSLTQVSNDETAFGPVDLNVVLENIKADLEIPITESRAVIQSKKLPVVNGISLQLHQLFLNLISNSLKFGKENAPVRIVIKSQMIKGPEIPGFLPDGKNRYCHISVKDNGIGFEQQFSGLIFEPFERLNSKRSVSGSGIGLAIVHKVVQNHNGVITAEGEPGVGATFNIYLPVT